MTCDEFTSQYWAQDISLEKEFYQTTKFVALHEDNFLTYSTEFQKLMLEIGSEVDVILKAYCFALNAQSEKKDEAQYRQFIRSKNPDFCNQEVAVHLLSDPLYPWSNWQTDTTPSWWTSYNKIKHYRTEEKTINGVTQLSYKFANLENTLLALSALFQICIYFYYQLATSEGNSLLTPLPGSRLFQLNGEKWENVHFFGDYAFHVVDGHLKIEYSHIVY